MAQFSRLAYDIEEVKRLVKPSLGNRWHLHDRVLVCRNGNRTLMFGVVCSNNAYASELLTTILRWENSHLFPQQVTSV